MKATKNVTWFTAPFLIMTAVLVIVPALVTFALSLAHYDALSPLRYAGLDNFQRMRIDPMFWVALENSFYFAAVAVPLRIFLALVLALLLATPRRGTSFTRVATYAPSVVPDIAYALVWLWMLNPLYGPVALALRSFGFASDQIMLTDWGARGSLIAMTVFQIGELYVVLLAARRELAGELYELCAIEGASPWFALRKVTLPLLAPSIAFLTARDVVWTLQLSFVPSLVITQGGPRYSTTFLPTYIYQNGFELLRFGYASAMTLVMFVLAGAMVALQVLACRLWRGRNPRRPCRGTVPALGVWTTGVPGRRPMGTHPSSAADGSQADAER